MASEIAKLDLRLNELQTWNVPSSPSMPEPRSPRLAVLIDADNASPRIADGLFEEIAKIGEASVRRIYGDFSGPA